MKNFLLILISALSLLVTSTVFAQKVTIFTEPFPPFQYSEGGTLTGASVEVVEAVMQKADIDYEIKSYPWARTYQLAQKTENALIFSISRRENREKLFQWIGIIVPSKSSVFKLRGRDDINIASLEDMKKFKIGTTLSDARESYLKNKGFDPKILDSVAGENASGNNYKKLKAKRIDLWPMPDAVAHHISRSFGDDPGSVLDIAMPLAEISTGGYYLAASLKTDKKIVEKLEEALQQYTSSDDYHSTLSKWGL